MTVDGPILLDVDGVLVDWNKAFHKYMKGAKAERVLTDSYNMVDSYPTLTRQQMIDRIDGFAYMDAYRYTPLVEGAVAGVTRLREAYPNSLIIAVTCCGTNPIQLNNRRYQLSVLPIDGMVGLPVTANKMNTFDQFRPGLVIEDSPEQLTAAVFCGHQVLIMDQPWNRDVPGTRAHGWSEICPAA